MALILHGSTASPFVRKVYVVLKEKGVGFDLQAPDFPLTEAFRALHPLKRMPVLQDTARPRQNAIPDSSVICDYLEHVYPTPALYPADPWDRARALWLEEYVDAGVFPHMGPGLFLQRVVARLLGNQGDENLARRSVAEHLPPMFDYLEGETKGREYLVADRYSIADIAVASVLVNYEHAGEQLDPGRWPALAGLVARVHARPAFAEIIAREKAFFARLAA